MTCHLLKRRALVVISFMLLLLTSASSAFGADMIVRDFKLLPTDQSAINSATMKKDQNGKTAALIKIYTNLNENQTFFDNGVMGIVARENRPGQIWLYIPARSQSLLITNRNYAPLRYPFEEEIQPGKTYSMHLTTEGKVVNLVASVRNAAIFVDGDSVGVSPHEIYLGYGEHEVRAQQGMMLYKGVINVMESGQSRFELPMEDESKKYSDVTVAVPGNAEIYYEGVKVGIGEWNSRLLGGSYTVELKKANYESKVVTFDALAGRPTLVECPPLVPYKGHLQIELRPNTGVSIYDGDTIVSVNNFNKLLNVGKYSFQFRRKGYVTSSRTYEVKRNEQTSDTVVMQRIQYVKPNSTYLDAAFAYGPVYGVAARLGGYISNVNLELGYTLGLGKSKDVYWYENPSAPLYDGSCTYTVDALTIKTGYQFSFVQRIGLTPQVGYLGQCLRGGIHGNRAMCHCVSIGARFVFKPIPFFGIFIAPEYAIPVSVNQLYTAIADAGGISKGGFYASAGISFNLNF